MILDTSVSGSHILYFDPVPEFTTMVIEHELKGFENLELLFSYSIDNINFSDWIPTIPDFLGLIVGSGELVVRIMINLWSEKRMLGDNYLIIDAVKFDDIEAVLESIEIPDSNVINSTQSASLFNPYAILGKAFELQEELSYNISNVFGWDVVYFRTEPANDGSVVFKAYDLHNVVEQKKVKVVVPNNRFPSDREVYTEWGYEFEDNFEVDLVVREWENVFGDETKPNAKDYLYFPFVNRMYKVNTVYADKQFDYKAVMYKMALIKWENEADVKDGNFLETIGDFVDGEDLIQIHNVEDIELALGRKAEIDTAVQPQQQISERYQFPNEHMTYFDDDITSFTNEIKKNGTLVTKYFYDMINLVNDPMITYKIDSVKDFSIFGSFVYSELVRTTKTETTLLDVYSGNDLVFDVRVNQYNKVSVNLNVTTKNVLVGDGAPLVPMETYFVVINYNATGREYITLTVFDKNLEQVQQSVLMDIETAEPIDTLNLFGRTRFTKLRVKNKVTLREVMVNELLDTYNNFFDYVLIDDAMPQLTGSQLPNN